MKPEERTKSVGDYPREQHLLKGLLGLGSAEAILGEVTNERLDLNTADGKAIEIACELLTLREVARAVEKLDDSLRELDKARKRLEIAGLVTAGIGVAVALVGLLIGFGVR